MDREGGSIRLGGLLRRFSAAKVGGQFGMFAERAVNHCITKLAIKTDASFAAISSDFAF
jgi:hypothetical protein